MRYFTDVRGTWADHGLGYAPAHGFGAIVSMEAIEQASIARPSAPSMPPPAPPPPPPPIPPESLTRGAGQKTIGCFIMTGCGKDQIFSRLETPCSDTSTLEKQKDCCNDLQKSMPPGNDGGPCPSEGTMTPPGF